MDYITNLNRFIEAQNVSGYSGYENAIEEIRRGKKLNHWIWYIFPQLKSLCQNSTYDKKYGISDLEEAKAYLNNSILRNRFDEACEVLLRHEGKTATDIFGVKDSLRVRSSLTLFYLASRDSLYKQVLDKYYKGNPCRDTLYALNMEMPETSNLTDGEDSVKHEIPIQRTRPVQPTKRNNHKRNVGQRKSKVKKKIILTVGIIGLISLFGCIGYGLYSLFVAGRVNPVLTEADSIQTSSPQIDFNLSVAIKTSDNELVTYGDIDKYSISIIANLGDNPIPLDTTTSKFVFMFNDENSGENIKIKAKIDTCEIGSINMSLADYDVYSGSHEDSFVLNVSKEDLRIYEELAWYQSAKQKVSQSKYPKYVARIKNVKNRQFADFLTGKLSTIGVEEKNQREDARGNDNDELPEEIMVRVRHAEPISNTLCKGLNSSQRRIIGLYNHTIVRLRHEESRKYDHCLRRCRTFSDLEKLCRYF